MNQKKPNEAKAKFTLFQTPHDRDNLSHHLPNLKINECEIKGSLSMKFLAVLVHGNLALRGHIIIAENKFFKNLELTYKATKP